MAKIRAYKLAEELGIERAEFVEKAAGAGVELRSAMALLDTEDVDRLRQKLGSVKTRTKLVTEKRVGAGKGATIIRRRKKEPEPVPEPVAEPPVAVAPAPVLPYSP